MPKIAITRSVSTVTATDGRHTRQSICANPTAAKALEKRLLSDLALTARWLRCREPVQLSLSLDAPPAQQLDLEDAISNTYSCITIETTPNLLSTRPKIALGMGELWTT